MHSIQMMESLMRMTISEGKCDLNVKDKTGTSCKTMPILMSMLVLMIILKHKGKFLNGFKSLRSSNSSKDSSTTSLETIRMKKLFNTLIKTALKTCVKTTNNHSRLTSEIFLIKFQLLPFGLLKSLP